MAVLSTSYEVESSLKTTLKTTISPSTTTGIQINYAFTVTSGVLNLDGGTISEEYISFGGATVSSGITTLSDVVRGLNLNGDTFTGSSTRASQHTGGVSTVELTNYHSLYNLKANKDRANTFTASQTISGTNKWFFNDSDSYIYDNGTDISFRSSAQSEVSLSTLAAAAGTDEKTKVSVTDTTNGYLGSKLTGGDGITLTAINGGGNETLDIDLDLAASGGLEISGGQLQINLDGSTGLSLGAGGLSIDSSSLTGVSATDVTASLTLGESGTATAPMAINGNGRTYNAQSDVLNDSTTFIGILEESGAAAESKSHVLAGIPATITALSVSNGRLWLGERSTTQNANVAVTGNTWKGQVFIPQAGQTNVSRIELILDKNSSPTGNYLVKIYAISAGLPTGAALGTATLSTSSMATGSNYFDFGTPVSVTPGTPYAIVLNHDTSDAVNNYSWQYDNANPYANGTGLTSSNAGGTWTAEASNDYIFAVNFRSVSGEAVFLQDSEGTLGLTPGTYHQEIGKALSTTQVLLNPQLPSIFATYTFSATATATVDTEITIGFRPRLVLASVTNGTAGAIGFALVGNQASSLYSRYFEDNNTATVKYGAEFSQNLLRINSDIQDSLGNDGFDIIFSMQATSANTITIRRAVTKSGSPSNLSHTVNLYILG